MRRAINLAISTPKEGGDAVASIIVKDNEVVAEALTTINRDPTCHAEINAIRIAADKLNSNKLEDCYLYSTFEPCPMCTSAAIWARMKGIVFGASMEDETDRYP